ncbi:unnamed protein product [Linum trigynum]|uniref:Expansin-like EG45 domain-containing protein n=1 Tax=Linum trigynum TaxID=586398 RepID=A0AAV2F9V0_9ROSI
MVTDLNTSNSTDFVLSSRAFMAMASEGKASEVLKRGIADVEYKRVPCEFKTKNLAVRVEESSQSRITWRSRSMGISISSHPGDPRLQNPFRSFRRFLNGSACLAFWRDVRFGRNHGGDSLFLRRQFQAAGINACWRKKNHIQHIPSGKHYEGNDNIILLSKPSVFDIHGGRFSSSYNHLVLVTT